MAYATISKPGLHMNTVLYVGDTTATQAITGVGFQPDWVWIKSRDAGHDHYCFQSLFANKYGLEPSDTTAERTPALGSFDSDGFTFASADGFYNDASNYVAWNWKANGATGATNEDGSTTSTVSVNTSAGFSMVTYTGTGSNATVGHGLGVTPKMIIVKRYDDTPNWQVYKAGSYMGPTKMIELNTINNAQTKSGCWNDTAPTSSVFTVGTEGDTNGTGGTFIAYCFAPIKGFSAFGEYSNNGNADGPFCYTGFQPELVIIKSSDRSSSNWNMLDRTRPGYNVTDYRIKITGSTEQTGNPNCIDILSNGFKIRGVDDDVNAAGPGDDYIYAAWAKHPLVANVGSSIPTTAF